MSDTPGPKPAELGPQKKPDAFVVPVWLVTLVTTMVSGAVVAAVAGTVYVGQLATKADLEGLAQQENLTALASRVGTLEEQQATRDYAKCTRGHVEQLSSSLQQLVTLTATHARTTVLLIQEVRNSDDPEAFAVYAQYMAQADLHFFNESKYSPRASAPISPRNLHAGMLDKVMDLAANFQVDLDECEQGLQETM